MLFIFRYIFNKLKVLFAAKEQVVIDNVDAKVQVVQAEIVKVIPEVKKEI